MKSVNRGKHDYKKHNLKMLTVTSFLSGITLNINGLYPLVKRNKMAVLINNKQDCNIPTKHSL